MHTLRREHGEVIPTIGDIVLKATAEFRSIYPTCVSQLAVAEKRLEREMENNGESGVFLKVHA